MAGVNNFQKLLLPLAMNSFARYAGQLLPYLNQSSVKMPAAGAIDQNFDAYVRGLNSAGNRLHRKFLGNVSLSLAHLSPRWPFLSENFLKISNVDSEGRAGRFEVDIENGSNAGIRYTYPAKISNRFTNSERDSSPIAEIPWVVPEKYHRMYVESMLHGVQFDSPEQELETIERVVKSTKLFTLVGTDTSQYLASSLLSETPDIIPVSRHADGSVHPAAINHMDLHRAHFSLMNTIMYSKIAPEYIAPTLVSSIEDEKIREYFHFMHNDVYASAPFGGQSRIVEYRQLIDDFMSGRSYALTTPTMPSRMFNEGMIEPCFGAFIQHLTTTYKYNTACRRLFNNVSEPLTAKGYKTNLGEAVFNLVWIRENEEHEHTAYPMFVSKFARVLLEATFNVRAVDIADFNQYDITNGTFKPFEKFNLSTMQINVTGLHGSEVRIQDIIPLKNTPEVEEA